MPQPPQLLRSMSRSCIAHCRRPRSRPAGSRSGRPDRGLRGDTCYRTRRSSACRCSRRRTVRCRSCPRWGRRNRPPSTSCLPCTRCRTSRSSVGRPAGRYTSHRRWSSGLAGRRTRRSRSSGSRGTHGRRSRSWRRRCCDRCTGHHTCRLPAGIGRCRSRRPLPLCTRAQCRTRHSCSGRTRDRRSDRCTPSPAPAGTDTRR